MSSPLQETVDGYVSSPAELLMSYANGARLRAAEIDREIAEQEHALAELQDRAAAARRKACAYEEAARVLDRANDA